MNTLSYNEVKELLNTIAAPEHAARFETHCDVMQPCEVEVSSTITVRFASKRGNELEFVIDAPDNEGRLAAFAKSAAVVKLDWRKAKYRPKNYYVAKKVKNHE